MKITVRIRRYFSVLIILVLFVLVFYVLWWFKVWGLQDLWVNLVAGWITLIGTMFLIDHLLEQRKQAEWKEASSVTQEDLIKLSNMLISYISSPLGLSVLNYKDFSSAVSAEEGEKILLHIVEDLLLMDLNKKLLQLRNENWRSFHSALIYINKELYDSVVVHNTVLTPTVLGKLLRVRKSFNDLFSFFVLIPDLLVNEEKDWPQNAYGQERNREIRNSFIATIGSNLQTYLKSVKDFYLTIRQVDVK